MRVTGGALGGRRLRVPARGCATDRGSRARVAVRVSRCARRLYARSISTPAAAHSASRRFPGGPRRRCSWIARPRASPRCAAISTSSACASARACSRGDAVRALRRLARRASRFDLVLRGPALCVGRGGAGARASSPLRDLLAPGGTLVVECRRRHALPTPEGLAVVDERHYGDTRVVRFEARRGPDEPAPRGCGAKRQEQASNELDSTRRTASRSSRRASTRSPTATSTSRGARAGSSTRWCWRWR